MELNQTTGENVFSRDANRLLFLIWCICMLRHILTHQFDRSIYVVCYLQQTTTCFIYKMPLLKGKIIKIRIIKYH